MAAPPQDRYDRGGMSKELRLDSSARVIHVPLSEAEWKAFLAMTPQPVAWLKERIQEAIAAAPAAGRTSTPAAEP